MFLPVRLPSPWPRLPAAWAGAVFAALAAICLAAPPATAGPITWSATGTADGQTLAAEATFSMVGNDLQIVLSNTGGDVLVPGGILTGVFFNLAGNPTLAPISAVLGASSTVLFGSSDPGGVVGGEWAYATGLSSPPGGAQPANGGANQGISSAGLGLFGGATFPGTNLSGPAAVDGLQYGITSALDNVLTGNAQVTGSNPLIRNSVVFLFGGVPVGFDPAVAVLSVGFQYCTALDQTFLQGAITGNDNGNVVPPPCPGVPEPGSQALLGGFLAALALGRLALPRRRSAGLPRPA